MSTAPRDDLLAELPNLIASQISAALPELQTCAGMLGGFDIEELKRQGLKAPAVLVSRLGVTHTTGFAGPHRRVAVAMAAFVVTRDQLGLKREIALGNISSTLLRMVPDNCWGLAGVGPADQVAERVLVNREARSVTAALSAVTWNQMVTLAPLPDSEIIPIEFYTTGLGEDGS